MSTFCKVASAVQWNLINGVTDFESSTVQRSTLFKHCFSHSLFKQIEPFIG